MCEECEKEILPTDLVAPCIGIKPCDKAVHRECADKLGGNKSLWVCSSCDVGSGKKVDLNLMTDLSRKGKKNND